MRTPRRLVRQGSLQAAGGLGGPGRRLARGRRRRIVEQIEESLLHRILFLLHLPMSHVEHSAGMPPRSTLSRATTPSLLRAHPSPMFVRLTLPSWRRESRRWPTSEHGCGRTSGRCHRSRTPRLRARCCPQASEQLSALLLLLLLASEPAPSLAAAGERLGCGTVLRVATLDGLLPRVAAAECHYLLPDPNDPADQRVAVPPSVGCIVQPPRTATLTVTHDGDINATDWQSTRQE